MGLTAGLDIGSVSVDLAVVDERGRVLATRYARHFGRPHAVALSELEWLQTAHPDATCICATGSGGRLVADLLGVPLVNEIVAHSRATAHLHPEVRTIIEVGGTESKLILLGGGGDGEARVDDFAMNALCAAGTGSFLDQQASRLKVTIEQFSELALKSESPPRVAGRCSVFAKSDMIHLQQQGTPDYDIIAGLCHAMARNFRGSVGMGKQFAGPIAFQGGVAANAGMVRAFTDVLGLSQGELVIPEHPGCMGAIGAALEAVARAGGRALESLEPLREYVGRPHAEAESLPRLVGDDYPIEVAACPMPPGDGKVEAYVGVDVGSISTNVVVIDRDRNVIARRYLMTEGRPIEAVKRGLYEVGLEVGDRLDVRGCATTGSGRYLTGAFIGADLIKNEITTHARAAVVTDPRVDTIFEIGGQDAKYVSLAGGAVVDFTMNKVCAAGTGSFLEEQAERLGLKIEEEFGAEALACEQPCQLGERCTVFMESDLSYHQQRGVPRDRLVAGLCYSIVYNYLNRVVENRRIGDVIFFQGGVAFNRGVKAAFEAVTGKKVIVPPQHDLMGAIGAAIIAQERSSGQSSFRGFDLRDVGYELQAFECKSCSNRCEIHRVTIEGREPLHYGSRCGRFDDGRRGRQGTDLPDLFAEREESLLTAGGPDKPQDPIGVRIGIPRAFSFFDRLPFWKTFFTELGCEVVLSEPTNRRTIAAGNAAMTTETCLPVAVAHGHALQLREAGVDHVFAPSIVNMEHESEGFVHSYACPLAQGLPYLLRAAADWDAGGPKLLAPIFHFERGRASADRELLDLARTLGVTGSRARRAVRAAWEALGRFRASLRERGRQVLDSLPAGSHAVVIVSRPYNGCDPGVNLAIPDKLRDLGVTAIPLDMLPLDVEGVAEDFPHMYWKYGQVILAGAKFIAERPNLHALYVTNFRCGPDSFITKFFDRLIGKPYLTIEVDEHSSDVGAITRCEAFVDSFGGIRPGRSSPAPNKSLQFGIRVEKDRRKVYLPHMMAHGELLSAALRARGVEAESLPMSNAESLELGRRLTTGKECYPASLVTGDLVKKTHAPDFDPDRSAFFMAQAAGPCRFGQYHRFLRMVLDDLGYDRVPLVLVDQAKHFGDHLGGLGPGFYRDCWDLIVIGDALQKVVQQTRPYECTPGETDRAHRECLAMLGEVAEARGSLFAAARDARRRLEAVPRNGAEPRPLIGLVGEIYVRSHEFANAFLVRRLERLGAEVVTPTFQEWLNYINFERRLLHRRNHQIMGLAAEWARELVARYDEGRVARVFAGAIRHIPREASTAEVVGLGSRYLDPTLKGEAILSMGRAVEYVHLAVDGVVNVSPFGCMPGALVDGLLERYRRDNPGLPVLKLAFDGTEQSGSDTQLEAFVHQARRHMEANP